MTEQPTLTTTRLVLRPFEPGDAPTVHSLAGDRDIAATTVNIPHPYELQAAERWIAGHRAAFAKGENVVFAITQRDDEAVVGGMGLVLVAAHSRAELGYWIGKPYWNLGYATEAADAVVRYGFEEVGLNRIEANFFVNNQASGRVLTKIGMRREGRLRQYFEKWGQFVDVEVYAILRDEFERGES